MWLIVAKGTLATWMHKEFKKVMLISLCTHSFLHAHVPLCQENEPNPVLRRNVRDTQRKVTQYMSLGTYWLAGQLTTDAFVNPDEIH